jgi:hypothetical protein
MDHSEMALGMLADCYPALAMTNTALLHPAVDGFASREALAADEFHPARREPPVETGRCSRMIPCISNTSNTEVVWHVDGIEGGNAAVWSQDSARFGSAHITITPQTSGSDARSRFRGGGGA